MGVNTFLEGRPMYALTVCNPCAWAIIAGIKRLENRSWPTSHRGPIIIHAGKSKAWLGREGGLLPDRPADADLVYGAAIGIVDVVDCVPVDRVAGDPFASGPWCWVLANPRPLPAPVYVRGKLGLWRLDLP
jgi:hypothetical protein